MEIRKEDLLESIGAGDSVKCPECGLMHRVIQTKDKQGNDSDALLLFRCGGDMYICGILGMRLAEFSKMEQS